MLQFDVVTPLVLVTGLVLAPVSGGELSTVLTVAMHIPEAGTHDELMELHGKYETLYMSQFS